MRAPAGGLVNGERLRWHPGGDDLGQQVDPVHVIGVVRDDRPQRHGAVAELAAGQVGQQARGPAGRVAGQPRPDDQVVPRAVRARPGAALDALPAVPGGDRHPLARPVRKIGAQFEARVPLFESPGGRRAGSVGRDTAATAPRRHPVPELGDPIAPRVDADTPEQAVAGRVGDGELGATRRPLPRGEVQGEGPGVGFGVRAGQQWQEALSQGVVAGGRDIGEVAGGQLTQRHRACLDRIHAEDSA